MSLAFLARIVRSVQRGIDAVALIGAVCLALGAKRMGANVAVAFAIDGKKKCIVELETGGAFIFSGRIHKNRSDHEVLPLFVCGIFKRLLKICGRHQLNFYVWGYADKQFFGFNFADLATTYRLETGLFGVGARYNATTFSYVIDRRAPYFDGRSQTDLENMLAAASHGAWQKDRHIKDYIEKIVASGFQKYSEVNQRLDIDLDEKSVVVVGQCEGDAAWIETDSIVENNIDLVASALKAFGGSEVFFKPHPFNRTNKRDIAFVQQKDLARVIGPQISFAQIAARRPLIVVNTSGAGLEAALRGCSVHTFGTSYYSHWGFTKDRTICARRQNKLGAEDVFHVLIYDYCKYGQRNPLGRLTAEHVIHALN